MPISDIVSVAITSASSSLQRESFGKPLILGYSQRFAERLRNYSTTAEMLADGFLSTDPEYRAAAQLAAQDPRVKTWAVGRGNNKPTNRWAVTPVASNSATYRIRVKKGTFEETYAFTADSSATVAEIIAGLLALINADTGDHGLTASDQTTYLRLLSGTAGDYAEVEVEDVTLLGLEQDHADPGVAADLAAILLYDPDWYCLLLTSHSKAVILAAAAWVETNKKLLVAATQDTASITAADGGSDVLATLKSSNYGRSAGIYHPNNGEFADAAWAGDRLPHDAGSETWALQQVAGLDAPSLTTTHRNNLEAKRASWAEEMAGRTVVRGGKVAADEWIDYVRGLDAMEAALQEDVFGVISDAETKIPYTDTGAQVVVAAVQGRLRRFVDIGFLAEDPPPTVSVPKVADIDAGDRAARLLPDVTFTAQAAGAIHEVSINGEISV